MTLSFGRMPSQLSSSPEAEAEHAKNQSKRPLESMTFRWDAELTDSAAQTPKEHLRGQCAGGRRGEMVLEINRPRAAREEACGGTSEVKAIGSMEVTVICEEPTQSRKCRDKLSSISRVGWARTTSGRDKCNGSKWTYANKGDAKQPEYRSRQLVETAQGCGDGWSTHSG